jgi:hypothetical protein
MPNWPGSSSFKQDRRWQNIHLPRSTTKTSHTNTPRRNSKLPSGTDTSKSRPGLLRRQKQYGRGWNRRPLGRHRRKSAFSFLPNVFARLGLPALSGCRPNWCALRSCCGLIDMRGRLERRFNVKRWSVGDPLVLRLEWPGRLPWVKGIAEG